MGEKAVNYASGEMVKEPGKILFKKTFENY